MQATVKRRLTKVALALVVAGYCAAPAVAANGNLKSGQWQIVSEQTGTIQGTVPWITRAADKTADTDKDHVTVTIDRGDRTVVTEGDKQFHVGDKVTVNWAIGDTEGDLDTDNAATKLTVQWMRYSDQNGSNPEEIGTKGSNTYEIQAGDADHYIGIKITPTTTTGDPAVATELLLKDLSTNTGGGDGTAPLADGANIPLYQGSMLLDPTKTYDIEFTAMPRDFSADASSTSMRAVNSTDTEGDLFTDPPSIAWENQEPPTMSLVWADAATPDTPLSPQPILNQTFCAQNLAGRQLVAWAQVEDENSVPALWLYTRTGVPNSAVISLLSPKVTLNIKPAVSDPVSVSGDHIDANFAASKVKAGESITLTVSTKACNGDVAPNAAFVIRREDAINRQGVVNNANPVRVGDTELTTTQTEYHGVTDEQGNATVVVTQEQGPGVKTRLIVSSQSYPTLTDNVDVIFTTITSPDSDKANMYGHMLENATATLNGTTYTFTRPKLAAETSGNGGTVVDSNETWAQFTWSGADIATILR